MLNGQVFSNQLFESHMFALFINTFLDGVNGIPQDYKNGMALTYSGSNVTIGTGAILIQGRLLEEDTGTTVNAGTSPLYCKLVVEIDLDKVNTQSAFNQGYYSIITDANDYPALTQTDIVDNVSGVYQYELARFRTTSSGITDFVDKRTFLDIEGLYNTLENRYSGDIGDLSQLDTTDKTSLVGAINEVFERMYPVGSIYMSTSSTNPSQYFGGTWVSWGAGRVPVGVSSDSEFNSVEKTGGAKSVTLSINQIPSHAHSYNKSNSTTGNHTLTVNEIPSHHHGVAIDSYVNTDFQTDDPGGGHVGIPPKGVNYNTTDTGGGQGHNHSISTSSTNTGGAGSGQSHSNLQPYITCYMFKRTA